MAASAAREAQPWLIAVLGAAFVGGLILNLMPCVLPVLSLKVFSLMKHAGDDPRGAQLGKAQNALAPLIGTGADPAFAARQPRALRHQSQ